MATKETFIVEVYQDYGKGKGKWIELAERTTISAAQRVAKKKRALGYMVRVQGTLGMGYLTDKAGE